MTVERIERRFARLRAEGRAGLVAFVTAGDPDPETAAAILAGLPAAGADVIELGMPFSDPMADGPAIQASSIRALKSGMTMARTLAAARAFRARDADTPLILMGYFNPIYAFGAAAFFAAAATSGVDGVILVDVPPEEGGELAGPAAQVGVAQIALIAPTTADDRLPLVLRNAAGFVYYVSVAGITGTKSAHAGDVAAAVARIRRATALPVAVGFGIKTAEQARAIAEVADAAVVGSAIVARIAEGLDASGRATPGLVAGVHRLVGELAAGVRAAGGKARGDTARGAVR